MASSHLQWIIAEDTKEPFIDLVDYFVDGQIVLLESSLEIKLNMSQPVGFYGENAQKESDNDSHSSDR